MILEKSEGISSRTNLVYFALEHNKFNYLKDESFSNQLWICLLKCLPGVVVVCVSGGLDNDLNHFLSVRGRSAGSFSEQLLVIEPTKAATLFLLLFFFCLTELENVGRHFSFYTSATGIVCYTAFFFSSRNASPSLPFPPLLLKIEESRVTTKNGWVAAVSPRKNRIIIECLHSRGQHLCKFIGTKESVCIRKEFNSQRISLGHQHGRCFIVLGHQYGRRDVM